MKKSILLNSDISAVIAKMGHTDMLVIGDCGLPIPQNVKRIDLALTKGTPSFLDTLSTVLSELHVEKIVIATEMKTQNTALYNAIGSMFEYIRKEEISHEELKSASARSVAIIRTGEDKPYANIILYSGVTF